MVAASYNNKDSTYLLLSSNASHTRADNTGRSAYDYAMLKNASETRKILEEFREDTLSSKNRRNAK